MKKQFGYFTQFLFCAVVYFKLMFVLILLLEQQIGQNRFLAKECSSVSHHPISSASGGSGGGNEDGNLAESKRQSEVYCLKF